MKLRAHVTSLLLIVAAAGLSVFYVLDRGKVTDTERRERDHDVFPAYRRADIDALELTQGDVTLKLVRRLSTADGGDATWQIVSPFVEAADPAAVDQLFGDLEFAGVIRRVPPDSAVGLDAPRLRGTLSMKPLVYHFALGGPAPIPEGAAYLRVDGEGTFVVSRDLVKTLLNPADTYRNRTVVPYLSLDLARLVVTRPSGRLVFDRADDVSFRFADAGPSGLRASRDGMDKIWSALAEARAESFLADADADRALGPDPVRVEMVPKDPSKPKSELDLGGACPGHPESLVLVRRSPTRASACVPKGARTGLQTPRDELVDRHLFAAHADEVEEIVLETVPAAMTVELARKGRGWHERRPHDRELTDGEAQAANELVTKLTRGEATRTMPGSDTFTARARARLKRGNESVEEVVELGAAPGVVRRALDGAVLDVAPDLAHRLWPSEIALRGPSVFPDGFASWSPAALAVRCDGVTERLTHDAGRWTMREPRGVSADAVATSDLAASIENAQAEAWIADSDDGTFGFEKSTCQVDLDLAGEGGKRTVGLVFGKERDDGGSYARASSGGPVFLAPRLLRENAALPLLDRGGFRADSSSALRVTLTRGTRARTFKGGKSPDSGHDAASRMFAALETLRPEVVIHFGPRAPGEGFDSPTLDVRVELMTDARPAQLHFILGDTAMVGRRKLTFARLDGVDATFGIARDQLEPLIDAF